MENNEKNIDNKKYRYRSNKKIKKKIEFHKRIPFETIPNTFYAIFRNKRRSLAMLSGIVLSISLLSGIILYNAELKQNNYDTMVQNYPYEIRFSILEKDETYAEMSLLSDNISKDPRVLDTSVMGSSTFGNRRIYSDISALVVPTWTNDSEEDGSALAQPVFVDEDYFLGPIGDTLLSLDFKGEANVSGQSVIISEQLMNFFGLNIGDSIDVVNFTQRIFMDDTIDIKDGYLSNMTIRGTYQALVSDSIADMIGGNPMSGQKIYLSIHHMQEETMEDIYDGFITTGNFYVAVKIDVTQFSVGDPTTFNDELNQFINQISRDFKDIDVQGENVIGNTIMAFQFFSIFITILYVILAIPVILLSLYLLNFGLEMSLEERRRLIAIKKVQGASGKQIFTELLNETTLLLVVGSVIGYFLGIIAAWTISTVSGFMKINFSTDSRFIDYLRFDAWAFFLPFGLVSLILVIVVFKKGKKFIDQEVTAGVARREIKKERFFRRHKLDVVFFLLSLSGLVLVILDGLKVQVQISEGLRVLIFILTPFFFWISGSSVGSRIVKFVPLKLERFFLRLPMLRDVKNVIKSGLKRRGDIERLAVIIIMTLSIAVLSTIQGNTEETLAQRSTEWGIGADWQIDFAEDGDFHETIHNVSGLEDSLAINQMYLRSLSSTLQLSAIENEKELANLINGTPIAMWQKDTFNTYTAQGALQALNDTSDGIFVPQGVLGALDVSVGDTIDFRVPITDSSTGETILVEGIKILGVVNQLPGEISNSALISRQLFLKFQAISLNLSSSNVYQNNTLNGTRYLVCTTKGAVITPEEIDEIQLLLDTEVDYISGHRSYYDELSEINTTEENYGISGLLSLNFIVSLVAALISAFSFSAILMERRKHEFAILRSIGAKRRHIYKMALGENSLMMLTASIWGIFIGIGISYLFNGVFIFINSIVGGLTALNRVVVVPGWELVIISAVTFLGMMLATGLSVKSAANQDLSLATKVI
ncbi:MAG: FtsX-like permease family protein [Promethearchaeota archaeon]